MAVRQLLAILTLGAASMTPAFAHTPQAPVVRPSLAAHERQVWLSTKHNSEYAAVPRSTARTGCEASQDPQALVTPAPILDQPSWSGKVMVSFIIGTDGRVHSPLVLESAGPSEDRVVLNAIRSWRYRPATCNGVPTEVEAKIGFSSR